MSTGTLSRAQDTQGLATARGAVAASRTVVASVYGGIGVGALAASAVAPSDWIKTQWMFTYQRGIPRRSLAGSILDATVTVDAQTLLIVSVAMYVAAVVSLAWTFARLTGPDPARVLLAVSLLASPAGFPFLAANLGRHDVFVLLVAVCCFGCTRLHTRWSVPTVAALLVVAVAFHEAAVLLILPSVAVQMWRRHGAVWGIAVAAPAGVAMASVMGWSPAVPMPTMVRALQARADFPVDSVSVQVMYTDGTTGVRQAIEMLFGGYGRDRIPYLLAATSPVLVAVVTRIFLAKRRDWLQLAAAAAPMLMVILGTDYERWLAVALTLATAVALEAPVDASSRRWLTWLSGASAACAAVVTACIGGLQH